MAETERQKLERYISIIESWRATRPADEIWSVFSNLEELDQKKNEALWNELEEAIKENTNFKWKPFQEFMKPYRKRAKKGYWWWGMV